jgi:hypothetical protein
MILIITLEIILSIVGFLLGLIALFISFGIISRTKDDVRSGFIFLFLGLFSFIIFGLIKILEFYVVIAESITSNIFLTIFIVLIIVGMWKLRSLIKGLSDFGQAFVVTSMDKYDNKLVSLVKDVKNVCFVNLKNPYKKMVDFFELYNIDVSKIHFIDATGEKCEADNCIAVKNNPKDLKNTIDKILKEKDSRVVIIDDISNIGSIQNYELPKFVQETAAMIKSNEAQGFFIGKINNLDKQIINDITMLVDKVIGDD